MTEPKRLLDHEETRGLERRLLEAGAGVRLSSDRKALLWQAIEAKLPPAGGGEGGDEGGGPPSIPLSQAGIPAPLKVTGAKLAAGLGLLAVLGGAGYWLAGPSGAAPSPGASAPTAVSPSGTTSTAPAAPPSAWPGSEARRDEPAASARAPQPSQPSPRETPPGGALPPSKPSSPELPAAEPAGAVGAVGALAPVPPLPSGSTLTEPPASAAVPSPSAAAAPSAAASSALDVAQQERVNLLREEAEMTRAARAALRSGSAGEALRLLEQARVKFGGRGGLQQEREALTIEALGRSGQREAARARAQAFLKAFPSSPHAPDVQLFAQ